MSENITFLETKNLTLDQQINVVISIEEKLQNLSFRKRFTEVLSKNPDFNYILEIYERKENIENNIFRFAPLNNSEIERSFSHYRLIFNDYRQSLKPETIFDILIFKFNQ